MILIRFLKKGQFNKHVKDNKTEDVLAPIEEMIQKYHREANLPDGSRTILFPEPAQECPKNEVVWHPSSNIYS